MASSIENVGQFGGQLPPGFRFHPTDQELIIHYLRKKVNTSQPLVSTTIADIDLYKFNPWELPEKALFGEKEWFFFSPRDRKYPNGVRPNRATTCGYWKATGTDKPIIATGDSQCLGVKKVLVFYKGRPPKGTKTDWVMHEYRLLESMNPSQSHKTKGSMRLDDWVLCRVKRMGNLAAGSDGLTELRISQQINTAEQEMKQQTTEEKSSPAKWTDQQLEGYLLGTCESTEESSHSSSMRSCDRSFCSRGEWFPVVQKDSQLQFFESMLSSIKRKLSFSVLDELILMQPENKRQQFWVGGDLSLTEFDTVNQDFDGLF